MCVLVYGCLLYAREIVFVRCLGAGRALMRTHITLFSSVHLVQVISEIRDRAVRERMAGPLPYELKFREPHPRSIKAVADFARETGDLHGLSAVDLKVGDDFNHISISFMSYHTRLWAYYFPLEACASCSLI